MFIENPLIITTSFRENITKIVIQNPEQKYIGKTCKLELFYCFNVLINGGEFLEESVGSAEYIINEFDSTLDIPTTKHFEYTGIDVEFYYSIKVDIIDAFGLFNATKEEKIILKKDLIFTSSTLENSESVGMNNTIQRLSGKLYNGNDSYNWKIMFQYISLPKKLLFGVITLCTPVGLISMFLPNILFGIGLFLLPIGLVGIIFSGFILFNKTDFFIKVKEKTKSIIWNPANLIQIGELLEGSSILQIETLKTKIQWNICEKGEYTTGSGTNKRTVTFSKPIQSIVIFEKNYTSLPPNTSLETILPQSICLPLDGNTTGFPITSQIFGVKNADDGSRNIHGDGLISEIEIRLEHPDFPDKINKFIILES